MGLINYEKYGIVLRQPKGEKIGRMLLNRHEIIESFLKLLGIAEGVLEETEKIEHTVSNQTLNRLEDITNFLKNNSEIIKEFEKYTEERRQNGSGKLSKLTF